MRRRRARAPRRGPLGVLGDGALLFLILTGTLFSFLTAFGAAVLSLPLLLGCAACSLLFLGVFSLPRRRLSLLLLLLLLLGLWLLALWRLWDTLTLGEIALRCAVHNSISDSLGRNSYIHPIAQLPEQTWLRAATALALCAAAALGALLGLSIVRLRSGLLTLLFSLPFLAVPLAFTLTPAWLPLMAVLLGWGVLVLCSLTARWDGGGSARLCLVALPVLALVLLLLNVALPQESYRRPAWADQANEAITNWAVRVSDRLFPGLKLGGGGTLSGADASVDLADAGPLRYSGRTVLEVSTSLRGRLYLRGFSGAVYDGGSWAPLDEQSYESEPLYSSTYRPAWTRDDVQPMNFPALADRASVPGKDYASVTIRNLGADPGYVYYPYQLLSTPEEISGGQFVHDAYLAREEGVWTHTLYVQPECDPLSGAQLPEELRDAEQEYARFVYQNYTGVPDALSDTLYRHLISMVAEPEACLPGGAENEHYQALMYGSYGGNTAFALTLSALISDYLGQLAVYDPATPAVPEGEDYVRWFLEESRRGYCMHFASAAVLLLRYNGVPARYVSGYVADVASSGTARVPDSNAHAWVEIYLDGYGWHPVEVTPAYAGAQPGQSGAPAETAQPTPTPSAAPAPSRGPNAAVPTPTPTPQAQAAQSAPFDLRLLLFPAGMGLLLALFALRRRLALRRRERRFRQADANRAVIEAYLYLRRLERWGGVMPETAEALAKKAAFSQHAMTQPEREAVVSAARACAARVDAALPRWRRLLFRYWFGL